MSFRNKYLKYKEKYLNLKKIIGGAKFGSESAGGGGGPELVPAPAPAPAPINLTINEITSEYLEKNVPSKGQLVVNITDATINQVQEFIKQFNNNNSLHFNASATKRIVTFTRKLRELNVDQINPSILNKVIPDMIPGSFENVYIININRNILEPIINNFNGEQNGFNGSISEEKENKVKVKFTRTIPHIDLKDLMNPTELLTEEQHKSIEDDVKIKLGLKGVNLRKEIKREKEIVSDKILEEIKTNNRKDTREINYDILTSLIPADINDSIKYNISTFHGNPIDYETVKQYINKVNETSFDIIGHVEEDTTKVEFIRTVARVEFNIINDDFIQEMFNRYGKLFDDDIRLNCGSVSEQDIIKLNSTLNIFSCSKTKFGKVKFTYKFIDDVDWTIISNEYLFDCISNSYDNSCRLNISTNNRVAIDNAKLIELVNAFNTGNIGFSGSVLDNNRVKITKKLLVIDWKEITEQFLNINLPYLYTEIRVNIPKYTKPDGTVQNLDNNSLVELVNTFNESQNKYSASVTNRTKVKFSPRLENIDFKDVYTILGNVIRKEGDIYRMIITLNYGQPIDSYELHKLIYMNNLSNGSIIGQKLYGDNKYIFTFKPRASNITREEIEQTITNINLLKDFTSLTSNEERKQHIAINSEIQKVFDKLNNLEVYRFSKKYNTNTFTNKQGRDKMIIKLNELLQNLDISATGNNTASTGNNTASTGNNTASTGNNTAAAGGSDDNLAW
jgi:hypothetical protein